LQLSFGEFESQPWRIRERKSAAYWAHGLDEHRVLHSRAIIVLARIL